MIIHDDLISDEIVMSKEELKEWYGKVERWYKELERHKEEEGWNM